MTTTTCVNAKALKELFNREPGNIVWFVGAGLSAPKFPRWSMVLKQLIDRCEQEGRIPDEKAGLLKRIDDNRDFLDIADQCANALGESRYKAFLDEIFDKPITAADASDNYKALFKLPAANIITTNYDRFPDVLSAGVLPCFTHLQVTELLRSFSKGKPYVFKLHGDITNHSSIIFTRADYQRLIYGNQALNELLKSIFTTRQVVFIGYSVSDPDLALLLEFLNVIFKGHANPHYAILPNASNFDIKTYENRFNIRVIPYNPSDENHTDVGRFLKSLTSNDTTSNSCDSANDISKVLSHSLIHTAALLSFSIIYTPYDQKLTVNTVSRAGTELEMQNELFRIMSCFSFRSQIVKMIEIYQSNAPRDVALSEYSSIRIGSNIDFKSANEYACKLIGKKDVWAKVRFFVENGPLTMFPIRQQRIWTMIGE